MSSLDQFSNRRFPSAEMSIGKTSGLITNSGRHEPSIVGQIDVGIFARLTQHRCLFGRTRPDVTGSPMLQFERRERPLRNRERSSSTCRPTCRHVLQSSSTVPPNSSYCEIGPCAIDRPMSVLRRARARARCRPASPELVEARDVRMVERRQHVRFALETREAIGVVHERIRQDLDGHIAAEPRIARGYTSPIPPAPMSATTSYAPSRTPGARDMFRVARGLSLIPQSLIPSPQSLRVATRIRLR